MIPRSVKCIEDDFANLKNTYLSMSSESGLKNLKIILWPHQHPLWNLDGSISKSSRHIKITFFLALTGKSVINSWPPSQE